MKPKTTNHHNEMIATVRIVYTICALSIFFVGFLLWKSEKDSEIPATSQNGKPLLTYEELQEFQEESEMFYPAEWKALQEIEEKRLQHQKNRQKIALPQWDQKQIARDLDTISENLQERSEALARRPISPILRIHQMRKGIPQTFALKDEELWDYPTVEPPTGAEVSPERVVTQNLAKPSIEVVSPGQISRNQTPYRDNSVYPPYGNQESLPQPKIPQPKLSLLAPQKPDTPRFPDTLATPASGNPEDGKNGEIRPHSDFTYNHEEGMKKLRFFNQKARNRLATYSRDIQDYACVLYKWDTTNNVSDGGDVMQIKLRENPYSVYSKSIFPERYTGREWLYWEGRYHGMIIVNSGPRAWNRTLALESDSTGIKNCATRSILQLGFRRLLEELIEISENEADFKDAIIRHYPQAKVGERACDALEVTFPTATDVTDFYRIQIYIDKELTLPLKLVIYNWPEAGKATTVRESYTYVITELNPGFHDKDFCHLNPEYNFRRYIPRISEEEQRNLEMEFPYFMNQKTQ
ncbi:MAG: DUF1571 domain-containing protein [Planctomycetia bacterium]|nr:DUF1571 domain-containing protein [Planctomycetia bacterium]